MRRSSICEALYAEIVVVTNMTSNPDLREVSQYSAEVTLEAQEQGNTHCRCYICRAYVTNIFDSSLAAACGRFLANNSHGGVLRVLGTGAQGCVPEAILSVYFGQRLNTSGGLGNENMERPHTDRASSMK